MASAFALGYMCAVPFLTTLTDRKDARLILLIGSAVSGLATFAFGLLADGLWSAIAIWGLAGIGFAGAYMPGLKALVDRLPPGDSSRSITFYTATFSIGVGLSFLIAQIAADALGWRWAFFITALGPLAMIAACLGMAPVQPVPSSRRLLDFMPVFRNRAAMGFILGYGAHCFELYALRTWIVAFWTYVVARNGGSALLEPITVSVIAAVLAMPSSIIGNETAIRFGRHRAIVLFMCIAGVVATLIGVAAQRGAGSAPGLAVRLRDCHSRRLRRADVGHDAERQARVSRRDHGHALDGGFWLVGGRCVGHRRRAGCRRRHRVLHGLAGRVSRHGGRRTYGPAGHLVVAAGGKPSPE